MAGNSIQAVTKDEWGPPVGRKQRIKGPARRGGRKVRALKQIPTMGHDYHGHLGLIWRVAGLQKDCFKVKVSCKKKAVVSKTSPTSQELLQPRHEPDLKQAGKVAHAMTYGPLKLVFFLPSRRALLSERTALWCSHVSLVCGLFLWTCVFSPQMICPGRTWY